MKSSHAIEKNKPRQGQRFPPKDANKKVSSRTSVPLLTRNEDGSSNLMIWKKRIGNLLLEEYGDLGRFTIDGEYFVPDEIAFDAEDFTADNDPFGFNRDAVKAQILDRDKHIRSMQKDHTACFATIRGTLSPGIEEACKELGPWPDVYASFSPLGYYRLAVSAASNDGPTVNQVDLAYEARANYNKCLHNEDESIVEFHERFDFATDVLLANNEIEILDEEGNVEETREFMTPQSIARDFLGRLNSRYKTFQYDVLNNERTGSAPMPPTLAAMYSLACSYKGVANKAPKSSGTVFMSVADGDERAPKKFVKAAQSSTKHVHFDAETRECFECHETGHLKKDCPRLAQKTSAHAPKAKPSVMKAPSKSSGKHGYSAIRKLTIFSAIRNRQIGECTVILDTGANTSRFRNGRILRNLRIQAGIPDITAFGGQVISCEQVGDLPGFFTVGVNPNFEVNIISLHEIECVFPVEYLQGDRYIVMTQLGERHFIKGGHGLYTAEFKDSPQATEDDDPPPLIDDDSSSDDGSEDSDSDSSDSESDQSDDDDFVVDVDGPPPLVDDDSSDEEEDATDPHYTVNTITQRRAGYSQRQLVEADKAWRFVQNANISQADAIEMVLRSPDVVECDITREGIMDAFAINVADVAAIKGKTRRSVPTTREYPSDRETPMPPQTMNTDVMFIRLVPLLISVLHPLDLTIVTALASQSQRVLMSSVSEQISQLASLNIPLVKLLVDRHPSLLVLQGKLTGIPVEGCGAGDHVGRVENRIKTIKEHFRTVIARLPYHLPRRIICDLVFYVVKRLNSMPDPRTHISPRVMATGVKINFSKEYNLGFGDYVEARDPQCKSNDAEVLRTESAIALWPTGNRQGSWKFLNLVSGESIVRSQFKLLPMSDVVIARVNELYRIDEGPTPPPNQGAATNDAAAAAVVVADVIEQPTDAVIADETDDQLAAVLTEDVGPTQVEEPEPDAVADNFLEEILNEFETPAVSNRSARIAAGINRPSRFIVNHISLKRGLSLFGTAAEAAVKTEILNMLHKEVFEPVRISELSKKERWAIIRSSIFLKEKFKPNGAFDKLKARLVADGSMQDRNIYEALTSPTVATVSVMCLLAISSAEGRKLSTVDIGSAYLNAELTSDVIMMMDVELAALVVTIWPELSRYLDHKGRAYVRLKKALYGCIESAKLWYLELRKALESFGYVVNREDKCVFNKTSNGVQTTLCVHVDDILCASKDLNEHVKLKHDLEVRFKEVSYEQSNKSSFLGMTIDSSHQGAFAVSMGGFVTELLEEFAPGGLASSPANNNLFDFSAQDRHLDEHERKRFHTLVAKLLYLGKRTRPDILVAVSFLCTRVTVATDRDDDKVSRVLKYLARTVDQQLRLWADSDALCVYAYVDASYGVHEDGKSHTGLMLTVGGGSILAKSSKQKIVTKSSTESELVAITDSIGEIIWLRNFLVEQGYQMPPAVLFQDNMSTIALCERGEAGHRTKHIKIRNFFIKELIDGGEVVVRHMPTDDMVADILTKPLQGAKFEVLCDRLVGSMNMTGKDDVPADVLTRPLPKSKIEELRGRMLSGSVNVTRKV